MNIFVLCTGRCGSTTFSIACKHIDNYSCAHESRCGYLGDERFRYPENHIEVDNRLSWLLGRLDKIYGDDAFYVHLRRDDASVANSYTKRYGMGIMQAYRGSGIIMGLGEPSNPQTVALDYCDTVNTNIELFLRDKSHKMDFELESFQQDFPKFWQAIGATGDYAAALAEFSIRYNPSPKDD